MPCFRGDAFQSVARRCPDVVIVVFGDGAYLGVCVETLQVHGVEELLSWFQYVESGCVGDPQPSACVVEHLVDRQTRELVALAVTLLADVDKLTRSRLQQRHAL